MIHPIITLVFPNNDESASLFSWICNKINHVDELEEFVKWHLDVNEEVVKEIINTQNIDFSNNQDAKKWATGFLETYEEKIRKMRRTSNQIFQRFHKLKNNEFKKIISENSEYEEKISDMMHVFLNKKELLIGKIIFAYREIWFLANHILHSNFKLGSISRYEEWVNGNISNLKKLNTSLEVIHEEILKWKE